MVIVEKVSSSDEGEAAEKMAEMFGPSHVDQLVRQAIQYCWMSLPTKRRNHEEIEKQIRRLVERALKDFRDDQQAFSS